MAKKRRSRWGLWLGGAILLVLAALVILARNRDKEPAWPRVRFVDVTERAGIRFTHTSGATPRKLLPESMGAGVVVIDYDNDGRPDLLFINSCHWPGLERARRPTLA